MEAPCFSRGKLDFSPAEERSIFKWASAPGFLEPGAKARDQKTIFFPRINAGAPTNNYVFRGEWSGGDRIGVDGPRS